MLLSSLTLEIVLVYFWPDEDFVMIDPLAIVKTPVNNHQTTDDLEMQQSNGNKMKCDSNPTLTVLNKRPVVAPEDQKAAKEQQFEDINLNGSPEADPQNKQKNPQFILLRMIMVEDGRLIKYIILLTVYGFLNSPVNFLFLSMEDVARQKGYNFSQLAGAVLISQAAMETVAFLLVPIMLRYISRSLSMCLGFFVIALRAQFYAGWYYDTEVSMIYKKL